MDKSLRNVLRLTVTACRKKLEQAASDALEGMYGIGPDGAVAADEKVGHLDAGQTEARGRLVLALDHIRASGVPAKPAREALVREIAYTHLNRLCSYKMMYRRKAIRCGNRITSS
jgi:hypothetical protein